MEQPPRTVLAGPISGDGAAHQYVYAFGPTDYANLEAFAERIDRRFLPRPQRAEPAIAAGNRHPEISLPAVFDAFHEIFDDTGRNLASTVQLSATREMTTDEEVAARDGSNPTAPGHTRVSIRHLYHAGLWAAIRAGYRNGYNAEADHFIVSGNDDRAIAKSVEWVKEAIRQAAGYTKFTTDTSRVFDLRADTRHPQPYSESEIDQLFDAALGCETSAPGCDRPSPKTFAGDGRDYPFTESEIKRLAVKFGPSLKLNEELFDAIARAKADAPFDFEPSLDEAETLTTPAGTDLLHALAARARPSRATGASQSRIQEAPGVSGSARRSGRICEPQNVARTGRPRRSRVRRQPIRELQHRVAELAGVARLFDGTLSIHSGSGKQPEVLRKHRPRHAWTFELQNFRRASITAFRCAFRAARRVRRNANCSTGWSPPASVLPPRALSAKKARSPGQYRASHGSYLGDASRGRVDGNLFLVFWLGNMVGCRDHDGRFFKASLDHSAGCRSSKKRDAATRIT